ncbi:MAG: hypothetical protein KJ709_00440 [Nanoarchaeota archaeon]|nr:hypothetical protein [Nanoarchaeota archaeon]
MKPEVQDSMRALELILTRESADDDKRIDELKERLLRGYSAKDLAEQLPYLGLSHPMVFLSRGADELFDQGSEQIVIQLGTGYVGKTCPRHEMRRHYAIAPSMSYETRLPESIENMRGMGLSVPEAYFVGVEKTEDGIKTFDGGLSFMITPDQTERGKYQLLDIFDPRVKGLTNSDEVIGSYFMEFKRLKAIYDGEDPEYTLEVHNHHTREGPELAIMKMYMVRWDTDKNTGELTMLDPVNVLVMKRAQQQQIPN